MLMNWDSIWIETVTFSWGAKGYKTLNFFTEIKQRSAQPTCTYSIKVNFVDFIPTCVEQFDKSSFAARFQNENRDFEVRKLMIFFVNYEQTAQGMNCIISVQDK